MGGYDNAAYQTPPLSRAHFGGAAAVSSASGHSQYPLAPTAIRPQPLGHAGNKKKHLPKKLFIMPMENVKGLLAEVSQTTSYNNNPLL